MYKFFCLLLISFLVTQACQANPMRDEDIEEIGSNHTLFSLKRQDDLYFVMEKITSEAQFEKWNYYVKASLPAAVADPASVQEVTRGALLIFQEAIKAYQEAETWVAYARSTKPKDILAYAESAQIEMSFAVLTQPQEVFQLHRGIARNPYGAKSHKGISLDLHEFAARAMHKIASQRRYVISDPLPLMRELFKKGLPLDSYQDYEGKRKEKDLENGMGVKHTVEFEGSWIKKVEELDFTNGLNRKSFNFSLQDHTKKILLDLTSEEEYKKYSWFFPKIYGDKYFIIDINSWLYKDKM